MIVAMLINTRAICGNTTILAGSISGQKAADALRKLTTDEILASNLNTIEGDLVRIDLSAVETVSSSFLREFLSPFFAVDGRGGDIHENIAPAFVGVSSEDLETELSEYFAGRGIAIRTSKEPEDSDYVWTGRLEKAVSESLKILDSHGPATAADLFEKYPSNCSGQTTWNNRLVTLSKLRLAARKRVARNWIYQTHSRRNI